MIQDVKFFERRFTTIKAFLLRQLSIFMMFNLFMLLGGNVFSVHSGSTGKLLEKKKMPKAHSVSVAGKIRRFYPKKKKDYLKYFYKSSGKTDTELLEKELSAALEMLSKQPAILNLEGNTAVFGDVHGDDGNLILSINAIKPKMESGEIQNVVFLGDYIDRGPSSFRALLILLRFFNENPGRVFLLRGNHETISSYINEHTSNAARNEEAFKYINPDLLFAVFPELPYAAIINGETLAVHGGPPHRDLWSDFWICGKQEEFDEKFSPIYSALWADYHEYGDSQKANDLRGGNPLATCYNEECVNDFFEVANTMLPEIYEGRRFDLKYLVHGHQPSISGTQSPNKIVTNLHVTDGKGVFPRLNKRNRFATIRRGRPPELFR